MESRLTNPNPIIFSLLKVNSETKPVESKAMIEGKNKTNENTNADKTVDDTSINLDFTVVVLIA